jgi:hypothetical protein
MPEPVNIPISIVDVTMIFARPNLRLAMDRQDIVAQLFERFARWDINVDDIEVIKEGKPSEQGVKFKIPKRRTSFFLGPASCRLTWDDANWETAEETIEVLKAGLDVLSKTGKVEIRSFRTSIALHLQPKNVPFIQLFQTFAAPQLLKIESAPLKAFATVLKWENRRITLDNSAQIANAIFLRFEREFLGKTDLYEIAKTLREDEGTLFSILGVEESTS